jgi:hypothetical protein
MLTSHFIVLLSEVAVMGLTDQCRKRCFAWVNGKRDIPSFLPEQFIYFA